MKKILLFCLLIPLLCCKKTNSAPDILSANISKIQGTHTWSGKRYFLTYNTSAGIYFTDSMEITYNNNIAFFNHKYIITKEYIFNSDDTLYNTTIDTTNKVILFVDNFYSSNSSGGFQKFSDQLSYNYATGSFLWDESDSGSITQSHVILHSQ